MTQENEVNFNEILEALSQEFSCDKLVREEDGRVLFALDDELGVVLFTTDAEEVGADGIVAVIALGSAPDDNAPLMRKLLCANYLGSGTADGTLAFDEEAGLLTLSRSFELPIDVNSFMSHFARLANAGRYWFGVIANELANSEDSDAGMLKV